MDTFDYPFHEVETENPESGFRGQFGNNYIFTTPPTDPDQRKFTLKFPMMMFFTDSNGTIDAGREPQFNMKHLINFYQAHKLWDTFLYNHPVHGTLEVKFDKPLKEPAVIKNGNGATKEFEVNLIEMP